jgi:peptidoglycan/LPS O-acetylase OafA/YrhL
MGQTWGPTGMAARAHYPALTGLRFCAALFVLLFHTAYAPYGAVLITFPPGIQELLAEGRAAVGLFFVLSGFVLTTAYFDWFAVDARRLAPYARARFARVYPLHLLMLIAMTPLSLLALRAPWQGLPTTNETLIWTWVANLFVVHALIPHPVLHVWNGPSWSLANEFLFYVQFPVFVRLVLARLTAAWQVMVLAVVFFALQALLFFGIMLPLWIRHGATADLYALGRWIEIGTYFFPLMRIWEFWIGCCLGLLVLRAQEDPERWLGWLWQASRAWAWMIVGAFVVWLGLVVLGHAFLDELPIISWTNWYVSVTPINVVLIAGLVAGAQPFALLLSHPLMVRLGEASYALYIIHWLPLVVLALLTHANGPLHPWVAPLTVVATILASIVCHDRIEQPLRRALRAWPAPAHDPKRATRPEA